MKSKLEFYPNASCSFFRIPQIPDAVFDVPTGAECDDMNLLLNKTIEANDGLFQLFQIKMLYNFIFQVHGKSGDSNFWLVKRFCARV